MIRLPRRQRSRAEGIVPMINVAFLLLVFLLLAAEIAPPAPFEVDLPSGEGEAEITGKAVFHVGADGRIVRDGREGEAAFRGVEGRVVLRADRALDAGDLARVIRRLVDEGATSVSLAVATKPE